MCWMWTTESTSNDAFDDTVQSGHAFNWENVTANTATTNSGLNQWDFLQWGASTGGSANIPNGILSVDSFEVEIGDNAIPEPSSVALLRCPARSRWSRPSPPPLVAR